MDKYLENAKRTGLLDVVIDWLDSKRYVSISNIQLEFSVGYRTSSAVFNYLIDFGYIEDKPTYNKGNKVIHSPPKEDMKIYLLDINDKIVKAFKKDFVSYSNVEVIHDDFAHFMDEHDDIDCVVSPGNAFGIMGGGYDKAITDYFGHGPEEEVQKYIARHLCGEQQVGTSIIVDIPNTNKKLIHTPSMRLPSVIKDPTVIYHCMRSTLLCALKNNIKCIVIPAFGGATGRVAPETISKYMRLGYEQIYQIKE